MLAQVAKHRTSPNYLLLQCKTLWCEVDRMYFAGSFALAVEPHQSFGGCAALFAAKFYFAGKLYHFYGGYAARIAAKLCFAVNAE